ncbi:MAG TPA: hypothetical protein DEH78_12295 [Solibacterales bacterium]|nr:hypothetical protein [Bryobacterales bacterium]
MSFRTTIEVTGVQELQRRLDEVPKTLVPQARAVMGRSGANTVRRHLSARNLLPNKRSWPKTNFFAQAARSVSSKVDGSDINIDVTGPVGFRQRYRGGTITPKNVKFLTLPAAPEAYGKRAREFSNLRFAIIEQDGKKRPALVQAEATQFKLGRKRKDGSRKLTVLGETGGGVMYWLVRRANQAPDPSVLPTTEVLIAAIARDTNAWLATKLNGGAAPGGAS